VWVSNHIFAKPVANKHYCVDADGIGLMDKCLTRGDLDDVCREVSRGHSTIVDVLLWEGPKVNRSKLSWDELGYIAVGLVPLKPFMKRNKADGLLMVN